VAPLCSLSVVSPGFLSTVQDLGRFHCAQWGISPAGAADPIALRLGNSLLGNPPGAPAIEMTLTGGSFRFDSDMSIALAGSDFGPTVDDSAIPIWQTIFVRAGQVLRCGPTRSGARCYLCVDGGIDVQSILSSSSTHLLNSLGGVGGRPLRASDVLRCIPHNLLPHANSMAVKESALRSLYHGGAFMVTPGLQIDLFSADERALFSSAIYVVKEESNRMGLRLSGPSVGSGSLKEMTTEGISLGDVQVPPDGQPIILFVEHPTTGGYPKIATVTSADIHRLGQCRPRDTISFRFGTHEEAFILLTRQERLLAPDQCLHSTA
jgi:antagonist of KipI